MRPLGFATKAAAGGLPCGAVEADAFAPHPRSARCYSDALAPRPVSEARGGGDRAQM